MTKYFKAFKRDATCREFKFEEGKTYTVEGEPKLCGNGYHFCKDLVLTLQYYPVEKCITENLYAEVEVLGETEFEQPHQHKGCTNKLKILRFLSDEEVLNLVDDDSDSDDSNRDSGYGDPCPSHQCNRNSGHRDSGSRNSGHRNTGNRNTGDWNSGNRNCGNMNSGDWNSGYSNSGDLNSGDCNSGSCNSGSRNSGDCNSGEWNSGHRNSGNRNTGEWNSGNRNSGNRNTGEWNSGHRNTGNRNTGDWNSGNRNSGDLNSGDWNSCDNSSGFLNTKSEDTIQVFNKPCLREVWEKADIPDFFYFKLGDDYKQSWRDSYNKSPEKDRNKVKLLPNFDAEVFFELTGIDLRGDTE